jgi:hypothetical protein
MAEQRLYAEVNGWILGGQFDRLSFTDGGLIQDYKVSSVWTAIDGQAKPEWTAQLNCLAWLARQRGIAVSRAEIVLLCRDWSASKARVGGGYPARPVVRLPVELWSDIEARRFIEERVKAHQEAETLDDAELPPCTPAERWEGPSIYAVRREGRKTAIKLFSDGAEALIRAAALGKGHYIEHRPGVPARCRDYCAVSGFCNQWQAELAAGGGDGIEGEP